MQTENRLVGAVRMRQIRVQQKGCQTKGGLQSLSFKPPGTPAGEEVCYPAWIDGRESTDPLSLDLSSYNLENDGTIYQTAKALGYDSRYWFTTASQIIPFFGDGYAIDIPSGNATQAASILQLVKESNWIDRQTRAVFVEILMYNPNIRSFMFSLFSIETPPSGGAIPFFRLIPMPSERFSLSDNQDTLFFVLEMIFLTIALLLFFQEIFLEILPIVYRDFRQESDSPIRFVRRFVKHFYHYFTSAWNSVDLLNVILLSVWMYYRVDNWLLLDELASDIQAADLSPTPGNVANNVYYNANYLADRSVQEYNWLALVVVLYWVKLLKYITLCPGVGPVVGAIVGTMFDRRVVIFAAVLLLIILSLTLGFFIAFGQLVPEYRSFESSLIQIGFITLGDFNFDDLQQVSPTFGPFMFFMVVLVTGLIMLNIFIAVISEVYGEAIQNSEEEWQRDLTDRMTQSNAVWRRMSSIFRFLRSQPSNDRTNRFEKRPWPQATLEMYRVFAHGKTADQQIQESVEDLRAEIMRLSQKVEKL